jgi:lipopolysaccharide cholinephosphotransferase
MTTHLIHEKGKEGNAKSRELDLGRVQARLLEMGKTVAEVLERNSVPYMIAYGTLLGAVRHGGFIPWDCDFDLLLFDETYGRGIEALRAALPEDLFVEDQQSEPKYFHAWAHVKDLRSEVKCSQFPQDSVYAHHGLCVDLYRCKRMRLGELRAYRLREAGFYVDRLQAKGVLSATEAATKREAISKQLDSLNVNPSETDLPVLGLFGRVPYFRCADVFPLRKYRFADVEFLGPCHADLILHQSYGNYMEVPPESARASLYDWVEFKD